jgi:hypothetical protein
MKHLSVSDGGHLFSVSLRDDAELPTIPERPLAAHQKFLNWWREQCSYAGITYEYRVAEPQGIKIIQQMLKKRDIGRLQELATHFFLDYGHKMRENPNHFAMFASLLETLDKELKSGRGED